MAYESDDPTPVRRTPPSMAVNQPAQSDPGPSGCANSIPARRGDDDPCPPRPPQSVMEKVLEEREMRQVERARRRTTSQSSGEGEDSLPEIPPDGRIWKFVSYSFLALLGLWFCHLLYAPVRNVLLAQTRSELVLACALLAITLGVFIFIPAYAWTLFSRLPKVAAVREKDYEDDGIGLSRRIEDGYVGDLYARRESYRKELRLRDDDGLMRKLDDLASHAYPDAAGYIEAFKEFQGLQDRKSSEVIMKYARRIAVKTAISPWRLVDMLAVFYNSTLMVCQIAQVYDRRVSRAQAFKLLMGWAFNLYVSGELGAVMQSTADGVNDGLQSLLGEDGLPGMVQPFLPMFSKIVGKAAEGGINAYTAYRFGKRAVAAFRFLH